MDGPRLFDIFEDPADLNDFLSSGFFSLSESHECAIPQPQADSQEPKGRRADSGLSFWSDGAGKNDLSPIPSDHTPKAQDEYHNYGGAQKLGQKGVGQAVPMAQPISIELPKENGVGQVEQTKTPAVVAITTPPSAPRTSAAPLLPPVKSVDSKKPAKPTFRIVTVDDHTNNSSSRTSNSSENLKSSPVAAKIPVAQVNPTPRPVSRLDTVTPEIVCSQNTTQSVSIPQAKPVETQSSAPTLMLAPQNGLNNQTFYGKIDGPNGPILLPISIINGQMVLTAQVQTVQTPNGMISLCIPSTGQFGGSSMPNIIMAPMQTAPQLQPEVPKVFASMATGNGGIASTNEKMPISKSKKKPVASASAAKKPNRVLKAKTTADSSSSPHSPAILPRQNSICVTNFPQQSSMAPQQLVQFLNSQPRQGSPQFQPVGTFAHSRFPQTPTQPRPSAAAVCQTLLGSSTDGKFTVRLSAEEQMHLNRINSQIQSLQTSLNPKPTGYSEMLNNLEEQRKAILRKAVFQQLGPQMEAQQAAQMLSQPMAGAIQQPLSVQPSSVSQCRLGNSSRSGYVGKRTAEHSMRTVAYALNSSPSVAQRLKNLFDLDKFALSTPDTKNPFRDAADVAARLLPYHLYAEPNVNESFLENVDRDFISLLKEFKGKEQRLRSQFQNILWHEAMKSAPDEEFLLMEKLALESEQQFLSDAKDKMANPIATPLKVECEATTSGIVSVPARVHQKRSFSPMFSDSDDESFSTTEGRTSSSLFGSPPLLQRESLVEPQNLAIASRDSPIVFSPIVSPTNDFRPTESTIITSPTPTVVIPSASEVESIIIPATPIVENPPLPRLTLKISRQLAMVSAESAGIGGKKKKKPTEDRLNNNCLSGGESSGPSDVTPGGRGNLAIVKEDPEVFSDRTDERDRCCTEGSQNASAATDTPRKVPPLKLKLAGLSNGHEKLLISKLLLKLPTSNCLTNGIERSAADAELNFDAESSGKAIDSTGLETSDVEEEDMGELPDGRIVDHTETLRVEPVRIRLSLIGGPNVKKRRRNRSRSELEKCLPLTTVGTNVMPTLSNGRESEEEEMEL